MLVSDLINQEKTDTPKFENINNFDRYKEIIKKSRNSVRKKDFYDVDDNEVPVSNIREINNDWNTFEFTKSFKVLFNLP